jgi:hypothetical protein
MTPISAVAQGHERRLFRFRAVRQSDLLCYIYYRLRAEELRRRQGAAPA